MTKQHKRTLTFRHILEMEHINNGEMYTEEMINDIIERATFWLKQYEKPPKNWSPTNLALIGRKRILRELFEDLKK